MKYFKEHCHRWWNLSLQLWCWNKSQFLRWVSKMSPRPKKKAWQIQSSVKVESDAYCVFWLWGCNSLWISTSWPDGAQGKLSEGDEERQWEKEGLIYGGGRNGYSIVTTLRYIPPFWFMIFSLSMRQCSSPSLCTH